MFLVLTSIFLICSAVFILYTPPESVTVTLFGLGLTAMQLL